MSMLTAVFKAFLGVGLSLSPFILLFYLAGPVLRRRYDPRLSCRVWLVFTLRLLFPVPLYGRAPLLIPAGEAIYFLEQDPSVAARAFAEIASAALPGAAPRPEPTGISWLGVGAMAWLCGAAAFFLFHLVAQGQMQHALRRWGVSVSDPTVTAIFEQAKREMSVARPIRLSVCLRIDSPMLVGFFRPQILLPQSDLQERQLAGIFRHELAHYKRGDLWFKLLLMTVLALHWYNPFVYLLVWQAGNALELACDADALRGGGLSRKDYGLAMLSQLRPAGTNPIIMSTQFYGGAKYMKIRIQQIADGSRKKSGCVVLALCVAGILAGSLLIGCAPVSAVALQIPAATQPEPVKKLPAESSVPAQETPPAGSAGVISTSGVSDPEAYRQFLERVARVSADSRLQYPGGTMAWPATEAEHIITPYGWHGDGRYFHTGVDMVGKDIYGTPVVAAQDGKVAIAELPMLPGSGYGRYILLDHGGGIVTLYAHLSDLLVQEGDSVVKGQQIGDIGATGDATGPHLHFEVLENGVQVDPADYLLDDEAAS